MSPTEGPLAFLLGTWRGKGTGHYPTIDDFSYEEEVTFSSNGKPFLIYTQKTWAPDGSPLHGESGYLRPAPSGIEFVLAHPFGAVEICEGTLLDHRFDLASTSVTSTSTAAPVSSTRRVIEVSGDSLHYDFYMATPEVPLEHHLEASLTRG